MMAVVAFSALAFADDAPTTAPAAGAPATGDAMKSSDAAKTETTTKTDTTTSKKTAKKGKHKKAAKPATDDKTM